MDRVCWNPIEQLDWKEARKVQEQKLATQLRYLAERSIFYQRRFRAAGIALDAIRHVEDLERIPFTTKQELRDSLKEGPPLGLHLAADPRSVLQIQSSSGTTGSPSYVGLTRRDIETWSEMGARVYFANGFRPGDVCLHAFSMSKGFVGGVPVLQILLSMGVADIPVGADAGTERLLRAAFDQRPNALTGTPYFLLYLGEKAREVVGVDARDLWVRKISVGGEPGGGIPSVRQKIEELWNADVREMCGGTDLGCTYWAECEDKSGMHYLCPDLILVEIIDPATGEVQEVCPGLKGELVYTALEREASPLLRFRTGDHVEVTGTDCRCGRTGYKIRVVGRTDDMLIVKGVNVFPTAIKDVVASFEPRTTGAMKVVVDFPGHSTQGPLKVRVEHGDSVKGGELATLKADVEKKLRDALSFRPEVELVPPDTFEKPGVQKVSLIERVPVVGEG
ncbi:MAG: AMP-binding protein [Candidatus Rokubacteria bacterium]|nr:AMP-binding protein [Candidatus Rokubacteria bacterium]